MNVDTPVPTTRFPWWIVGGGLLLALVYVPTLAAPFDFIDDGNLVYPVPEPTLSGQVRVWWDRVVANVDHLGPFRPVLLAHWQVQSNLLDADPLAWRAVRLAWLALSAMMLLWLLRELKCHPVAALVAAAAAMWNPYRGEIWRSLTLQEGVAMPYAMLALIAARKAADSTRPWRWDAVAILGLLLALGCKNVFVALLPAMAVLRVSTGSEAGATRRNLLRASVYLLPVVMPAVHFVYFKLNWKPGNYEMTGPTWGQAVELLSGLKGGVAADFLAAGVALVLGCVWWSRRSDGGRGNGDSSHLPSLRGGRREAAGGESSSTTSPLPVAAQPTSPQRGEVFQSASVDDDSAPRGEQRAPILAALALLVAGLAVYLPVNVAMSGRYTMPAVWGADILLALLLTRFLTIPDGRFTRVAWAGVGLGLLAVAVACYGRQEKDAARSRLLWDVLEHLEKTATTGEPVAWISGDSSTGELNAEEGIHFHWHLLHRGRGDIRIGLSDAAGAPIKRVELPPLDQPARLRITAGAAGDPAAWEPTRTFTQTYRLGRKRFECRLETAKLPPTAVSHLPVMPTALPADGQGFALDPFTAKFMKEAFAAPGRESETLLKLRPKLPGVNGAADLLIGGER